MNRPHRPTTLIPLPGSELARLHDRAREDAEALRAEAIDDFWRGANAAFVATLNTAQRSAERLAHRLARRRAVGRARQLQATVSMGAARAGSHCP